MVAILHFLGTNCQYDVANFYTGKGIENTLIWHTESTLPKETKLAVIAGGFSYGDYLRCGAIAAQAQSMKALKRYAENGGRVLGICNGFQILCESKLLPGVLMRNKDLKFISKNALLRVKAKDNAMLKDYGENEEFMLPIAHAEGNYQIDSKGLETLYNNNQVLLQYADDINGSVDKIAGICNKEHNIFGLMPHPERAVHTKSINTDSMDNSSKNAMGIAMLHSLYNEV
ncbi:phosphoribosylformylglycinamidine synthase subunit PurQ [Helicobacter bilis]|uniref:Phosphoribosylformylglycinamidine synthase subunit PurQ n=1 Tax=Helicobacter bilis TaxID=37372 RepID=A0A4U8U8Q5_9HELI|nr:phosphoribosylformylglycinamidine synthase subunit PurQ [Helicobacter bilis]MCI7411614.1 phosphoribosylformylglycinamidine synthase subunit PurQ [Helicobacter bilis]MDD7295868.1 phosphoribosylformylglycinamidine synthase subunit PurQ [Helicobacter bilis]MDY4400625.1 phosphoribosylformylglycinamidine synthase subunit PurQ [Helicobacter bilis]TLE08553.1 phosphoribosylformylglycinamidine synthase subunit PurQ [Helicobacter bilis]TLE10596.1 phosphoribosylformylglycinamidine synthase subunit Pur